MVTSRTIQPCGGAGASPYGLAFNPANNKLYIVCSPFHNVNRAAVYRANATGLTRLAFLPIGDGGEDGGGGVAVDGATSNVFFTNSAANTVSVISGSDGYGHRHPADGPQSIRRGGGCGAAAGVHGQP